MMQLLQCCWSHIFYQVEEHLEDEESRGGKSSAWSCDGIGEDWAALLEGWPGACLYLAGEEQGKQDCPMMK